MRSHPTLRDVAVAANVSKTTVSNVFSRPGIVRPEVRAIVEAVARELGYAGPNPKGRMLSSGKVNVIGVVSIGQFGISLFFKNAYQRDFLAGVAEVCEERGVGLTLVSSRPDQAEAGIRNALVDGFIFTAIEQLDFVEAAHRRLPFVVMDTDRGPGISSVRVENRDGARQAVRHLLALGHRRFVIGSALLTFRAPVFHPPSNSPRPLVTGSTAWRERLEGVAEALCEAGISINDVPLVEACGTPEEEEAFGNGAAMILDRAPEATAVIALTDSLALNVIAQAKLRGISVPRDLSVVGFDDIPEAALSDPPLSTVHQSANVNGRTAASILLDGGPPRQVSLPVTLIIRNTTAHPRERRFQVLLRS